MPSGLQCSMHWFPPPVKTTRRNMILAVERDVKQQINLNFYEAKYNSVQILLIRHAKIIKNLAVLLKIMNSDCGKYLL